MLRSLHPSSRRKLLALQLRLPLSRLRLRQRFALGLARARSSASAFHFAGSASASSTVNPLGAIVMGRRCTSVAFDRSPLSSWVSQTR